jgi:hypothetical protein
VISLRHVGELGRGGAAEIIAKVPIGIESKTAIIMRMLTGVSRTEGLRVRVALLVMMEGVAVENHDCAFWNEHPVVDEVFCGTMRRSHPEGSVNPLDLSRNQLT